MENQLQIDNEGIPKWQNQSQRLRNHLESYEVWGKNKVFSQGDILPCPMPSTTFFDNDCHYRILVDFSTFLMDPHNLIDSDITDQIPHN